MRTVNTRYIEFLQKRAGLDNYVSRPVQTFNFQHKKIAESVEKANANEVGVFASAWDIEDNIRQERKSEF
jgi:isopropylmalate/homocitrate/citramalate synthase